LFCWLLVWGGGWGWVGEWGGGDGCGCMGGGGGGAEEGGAPPLQAALGEEEMGC